MDESELEKIEQKIFESVKNEVGDLPRKEQEKIIKERIKDKNYLSEDWQVDYAVDRIRDMVSQSNLEDRVNRIENKPRKSKILMVILTIFSMIISFFVMIACVNMDNKILKGALTMGAFAIFVYPIQMWWKSFTSKG